MRNLLDAFLVTLDVDGQDHRYVVFGEMLPDAAQRAVRRLRTRGVSSKAVTAIKWLGPALVAPGRGQEFAAATMHATQAEARVAVVEDAQVGSAARPVTRTRSKARDKVKNDGPARAVASGSRTAKARGPTRAEQLVEFLRGHSGEAHIGGIGAGLGLDMVNVQNTVASAARKGWVRRIGKRTGIVALVEADLPGSVP